MQDNLKRLKALVLSARRSQPGQAGRFEDLYTDDVKLRWQGVDWPWGGDMQGRQKLAACMHVTSMLFVEPLEFWESTFWILDDERLLWWWRSRGRTFNDEAFSNSGLTILRYRDNKICEHWEYTDTQYLAHMFRGWRDLVAPEVGDGLASWPLPGPILFADPGLHT